MASFVKSTKNADKLVFEGFIYVKYKNGAANKRYWRCEYWRSCKCYGFAVTNANNEVTVTKQHNHGPSPNRIELARIKDRITQAAINSTLSPREIVNEQLAGISEQAKATLPKFVNLQKTVGRKRYADGYRMPLPNSLSEIEIPEQLRRTKTELQEDFILVDTGPADPNRIILLGSRTDVARLAGCDVWICDGTFKNGGNVQTLYQLWIIYGRFGRSFVLPFIYILIPSKTTDFYLRSIELLLVKVDEINPGSRPQTIIIDFEKVEEQALRNAFPYAIIHGCFFHFKESILRKIQEFGWGLQHQEEDGFLKYLKMFVCLTFVDPAYVRASFHRLAQMFLEVFSNGDLESPHFAFIDYMERTWVGRELMPPRYPPTIWNNKDITIEQLPKSSNSVESWHNTFSGIFNRHSSNPYNLVRALLDKQARVDTIAVRISSGAVVQMFSRPEYRRDNQNLLNVLRGVGGPRDPIEFLTACSNFINF
uniref:Uncharacterized protein n=1 Tax=Meloidogyne enterolobii TaxID=390850 RepID=A0A6V7VET1_MELEN|nr:unnamed protein product [Meloidogyne enterolobii]